MGGVVTCLSQSSFSWHDCAEHASGLADAYYQMASVLGYQPLTRLQEPLFQHMCRSEYARLQVITVHYRGRDILDTHLESHLLIAPVSM